MVEHNSDVKLCITDKDNTQWIKIGSRILEVFKDANDIEEYYATMSFGPIRTSYFPSINVLSVSDLRKLPQTRCYSFEDLLKNKKRKGY